MLQLPRSAHYKETELVSKKGGRFQVRNYPVNDTQIIALNAGRRDRNRYIITPAQWCANQHRTYNQYGYFNERSARHMHRG